MKSGSIVTKYYNTYKNGIENREPPGIMLRIAKEHDVNPCLVSKLILQRYYSILNTNDEAKSPLQVNKYIRDTTLIEDMDLAYEVYLVSLVNIMKFLH